MGLWARISRVFRASTGAALDRIENPAQCEHGQSKSDDPDDVRLARPGQRVEGRQDAGILDRSFDPHLPLRDVAARSLLDQTIQTPVTRCRPPPRSSRLNMRTMFGSLLSS